MGRNTLTRPLDQQISAEHHRLLAGTITYQSRSRLSSASSDVSQFSIGHSSSASNYVSPQRRYMPPSDIESEHEEPTSDHESSEKMSKRQKLLTMYKNKFKQFKDAYDEVERENEHVRSILQQQQDQSTKRLSELREQIKLDKQAKEHLEVLYQKELKFREAKINELNDKLTTHQNDMVDLSHKADQEEIKNLKEKNGKLEDLLIRCKATIKNHETKQHELVKSRDDLNQRLKEKESLIDSMMKERHPGTPNEFREHFESDIAVLLRDKERLLEQLESTRYFVKQLESELEKIKQKQVMENDEEQQQIDNDLATAMRNKEDELAKKSDETDHLQMLLDAASRERDLFKQKCEEMEQQKNQDSNMKASADDHNQQINDLTTNIESLKSELDKRQKQIDSLNDTIHDFQVKHEELKVANERLIEEKERQVEEQSRLNEQREVTHQQTIDSVKLAYEKKVDELKTLNSENEEKLDNLNDLQAIIEQLTEEQSRSTSLEEKIENLEKDYLLRENNFKTTISNQQLDIGRLNEEKEKLTVEISSINNALANSNVSDMNSDNIIRNISYLKNEIERLRAESEGFKTELRPLLDIDTEYDEIPKIIEIAKSSYSKMKNKSSKYENEIDELKKFIDRNRELNENNTSDELKKLHNKIDLLTNEQKEKQHMIGQLTLNASQKEDDINRLSEKCEQYEVTIDDLKKHIKQYEIKINTIEAEISTKLNYESVIKTLENGIDTLKETLNNEEKRYIDQTNQMEMMKKEYENKVNVLIIENKEHLEKLHKLEEITTLQLALDNVSKERNSLKQMYDEMEQAMLVKQQQYEQKGEHSTVVWMQKFI
ncbi:unnamed protein product [Didymodactylos carnosus]|uniref:Uncharacterized protein n=1 Tax=Didymodactylos carnosus TaxID=1234261 RepID=A0A814QBG1_9BILA|nr:unnamed protein product [Didymodactylos carnosus]CAF3880284.1 unnamed protein product [Didymodactylos carnosus]